MVGTQVRSLVVIGLGVVDDVDLKVMAAALLNGIPSELGGGGKRMEGTFLGHPAELYDRRRLLERIEVAVVSLPGRVLIVVSSGQGGDDVFAFASQHVTIDD